MFFVWLVLFLPTLSLWSPSFLITGRISGLSGSCTALDLGKGFSRVVKGQRQSAFPRASFLFFSSGSPQPRAVLQQGSGEILLFLLSYSSAVPSYFFLTIHTPYFSPISSTSCFLSFWQATILGRLLFCFVGTFSPCLLHTSSRNTIPLLQAAINRRPIPGKRPVDI